MSAEIIKSIVLTAEMTGAQLSDPTIRAIALELGLHEESKALKALARCRRELKHRLTLADILDRIVDQDGHVSSDEAWGKALTAFDESASVLLTNEICEAMGAARSIFASGDRVGARMAFKNAYDRLVKTARDNGQPAKWHASLGMDIEGRDAVIREGVEQGRLPAHTAKAIGYNNEPVTPLLENPKETERKAIEAEKARERLQALIGTLTAKSKFPRDE